MEAQLAGFHKVSEKFCKNNNKHTDTNVIQREITAYINIANAKT
jgi:hypothetical protein